MKLDAVYPLLDLRLANLPYLREKEFSTVAGDTIIAVKYAQIRETISVCSDLLAKLFPSLIRAGYAELAESARYLKMPCTGCMPEVS